MQTNVDIYVAIIGTALTAFCFFWPVNIAVGRASSEYVKLLSGLLDGKMVGKNVLLTVHPCIIFFKWTQLGAHYFLLCLFQFLYMFRATMCPSSGELTVSMRHWYFSLCVGGCLVWQTRQPPTQSKKYPCRIDTVSSPDDGHIVARNM